MNETPLGRPLARGRNADVYAWDDGTVLKLYHSRFEPESIEREASIARAAYAMGLPVPAVGEIIHVAGADGLTFERVYGCTMLEAVQRTPWRVNRYARSFATLHAQMHARPFGPDIPGQRQLLEGKIRQAAGLTTTQQSAVLAALQRLPDGDRICHGDFHPGNILMTARGEVIIDWMDGARGNPLADVARSTIIALGAIMCRQIENPLMRVLVGHFHRVYLRNYFGLCPGGEQEYRRWLPVAAAARLSENIPELETWLVARARRIEEAP